MIPSQLRIFSGLPGPHNHLSGQITTSSCQIRDFLPYSAKSKENLSGWGSVEVFMTVFMNRPQEHGRRGQRIDTRYPGRQSQKVRLCLADGEIKLIAFSRG